MLEKDVRVRQCWRGGFDALVKAAVEAGSQQEFGAAMTRNTSNAIASNGQFTLLIISDKPVLRYGLRCLFSHEPSFKSLEEAENVSVALQKVEAKRPDLALISLPLDGHGTDGLIAQFKAKHPPLKVLAGVRHDDPSLFGRMIRAGADGCIHWGEEVTKIVEAVHTVLHGGLYIGSRTATRLLDLAIRGEPLDGHDATLLSDREWHVFIMIGQGLTTMQIADKLDMSRRTVESHRKKIKLKFGLQNAAQLSHIAYESWQELR
jgi:DNA-binding NarL/FixJ family response regulator